MVWLFILVSTLFIGGFALILRGSRVKGEDESRVLVVLGSGGHTAEMLTMLRKMGPKDGRTQAYVVAATDQLSAQKAEAHERSLLEGLSSNGQAVAKFAIYKIPRSREVGQSYVSSVWTTLVAMVEAVRIVLKSKPDLVLVNGPGTCIPICIAAIFFRRDWTAGVSIAGMVKLLT